MKRNWIAALVMGITLLSGVARANGGHSTDPNDPNMPTGNPTKQCIADARTERKTCTQVCSDNFLASVDTCRGLNHDCADTARTAREACVSDILKALSQCIQDTCGGFKDVIAQCRKDFPAGSSERDKCVDGQQLLLFQCRDQCRESVQLFQSLKTCRDEFKADIAACAIPAPTPKSKR
jgi:hypothetical protein